MRWIALFFLVLFLALTGFFIFFLSRFNPNDYRPYLESRLSEKLGMRVSLGNLSLTWRGGLGIEVDRISLFQSPSEPPLLNTEDVLLHFDSLNLFRFKFVLKTQVTGVRVHYRDPAKKLPLDVDLGNIELNLDQSSTGNLSFVTKLLNYNLKFKGDVFYSEKPLRFKGKIWLNRLDLSSLGAVWQWVREESGGVSGIASGEFEFAGSGEKELEIRKSLTGKGYLEVREGVIQNFNMVDSLLSRISAIPGLRDALLGSLPPAFQEVLTGRDMAFNLFHADFVIQNDELVLQALNFEAPHYIVQAQGTYAFVGNADFQGKLELLKEISDFLVHRVNELAGLNNAQGHLEIPFSYRGPISSARLLPDTGHVIKKVVLTEGAQLLERGLEALSKYAGENK